MRLIERISSLSEHQGKGIRVRALNMNKRELLTPSCRELVKGKRWVWPIISFFLTTSLGLGMQEIIKFVASIIWHLLTQLF